MQPFSEVSRTEIEYNIEEWIHNQRDREVAKSRFLDGLTYEKLSEIYELSVNQTKNIVQKVKNILLTHIPQ